MAWAFSSEARAEALEPRLALADIDRNMGDVDDSDNDGDKRLEVGGDNSGEDDEDDGDDVRKSEEEEVERGVQV